jgi:hypothetical protein
VPTVPGDPAWLTRLVARFSLQPPIATPHTVFRYGNGDGAAYLVSDRCCDIPRELFDRDGRKLGCVGNLAACGRTHLDSADGSVVWQVSEWRPDAARAVLADPRLAGEDALRTYAQLELDTNMAWTCDWPDETKPGPAVGFRRDDVIERPDHPVPDGDLGILGPGPSREEAALTFLRRYKALLGMPDFVRDPIAEHPPTGSIAFVPKVNGQVVQGRSTLVYFDKGGRINDIRQATFVIP